MKLPPGKDFCWQAQATSGAVNKANVHIKNPTGSGVDLFIYRITITCIVTGTAEAGWIVGRKDSDLSGSPSYAVSSALLNSNHGTDSPTRAGSAATSHSSIAATVSGVASDRPVTFIRGVTNTGDNTVLTFGSKNTPIKLGSATGLVLKALQGSAAVFSVSIDGRECPR